MRKNKIIIIFLLTLILGGCKVSSNGDDTGDKLSKTETTEITSIISSSQTDSTEQASEQTTEQTTTKAVNDDSQYEELAVSELVPIAFSDDDGNLFWGFAKDAEIIKYYENRDDKNGFIDIDADDAPKCVIEPIYESVTPFNKEGVSMATTYDGDIVFFDESNDIKLSSKNLAIRSQIGNSHFMYYSNENDFYVVDSAGEILLNVSKLSFGGVVKNYAVFETGTEFVVINLENNEQVDIASTFGINVNSARGRLDISDLYTQIVLKLYNMEATRKQEEHGSVYTYKSLKFDEIEAVGDRLLLSNLNQASEGYKSGIKRGSRRNFLRTMLDTTTTIDYSQIENSIYWLEQPDGDTLIGGELGEAFIYDMRSGSKKLLPRTLFNGEDFFLSKNGLLYAKVNGIATYTALGDSGRGITGQAGPFVQDDDIIFYPRVFGMPGHSGMRPEILLDDSDDDLKQRAFKDSVDSEYEKTVKNFRMDLASGESDGYLVSNTEERIECRFGEDFFTVIVYQSTDSHGTHPKIVSKTLTFRESDGSYVEKLEDIFTDGVVTVNSIMYYLLETYKDRNLASDKGLIEIDLDKANGANAESYANEIFNPNNGEFNFYFDENENLVLIYDPYLDLSRIPRIIELTVPKNIFESKLK